MPQLQAFAFENPAAGTSERVPASLGWPHSPLAPANKPCSPWLPASVPFLEQLRPNTLLFLLLHFLVISFVVVLGIKVHLLICSHPVQVNTD